MAKNKRPKPVTLDQAINALRELTEWAAYMGSWENPCWKHARSLLDRWRDQKEQEINDETRNVTARNEL